MSNMFVSQNVNGTYTHSLRFPSIPVDYINSIEVLGITKLVGAEFGKDWR